MIRAAEVDEPLHDQLTSSVHLDKQTEVEKRNTFAM